MKYKIHYSQEFRRDLDEIWGYILSELQNSSAVERIVNSILDDVDQLRDFAEMRSSLSSVANMESTYRFSLRAIISLSTECMGMRFMLIESYTVGVTTCVSYLKIQRRRDAIRAFSMTPDYCLTTISENRKNTESHCPATALGFFEFPALICAE